MIQSDKFDSFMNFKNNIDKIKSFAHRRLIEIFGILILILAFLTLISLMSYNPNDPNFIYSENQIINNFWVLKEVFWQISCCNLLALFHIFFR